MLPLFFFLQIIAFNLGSMGFLANHEFENYESDLSDMIYGRTHRRLDSDVPECACNDEDGEEDGDNGTLSPLEAGGGEWADDTDVTPGWANGGQPKFGPVPRAVSPAAGETPSGPAAALPVAAASPPSRSPSPTPSTPPSPVAALLSASEELETADGLDVRLCREAEEEGCAVLSEDEYGLPDEQLFPKVRGSERWGKGRISQKPYLNFSAVTVFSTSFYQSKPASIYLPPPPTRPGSTSPSGSGCGATCTGQESRAPDGRSTPTTC